jgi:hypothetical protein
MADAQGSPVLVAARRSRAALLARDKAAVSRLVQVYGQTWVALQKRLLDVENAIAAGEEQAAQKERLLALADQVEMEIARYAIYADQETLLGIQQAVPQALTDAARLVRARLGPYGDAAIKTYWNHLPADAVETLTGMTGEQSPLYQRMTDTLGRVVADQVRQQLLKGLALGWNSTRMQGVLRSTLGQGLTWSLAATRTARNWAYREATRAGYLANSKLVKGWTWHAALDLRACLSCWAMHGTEHPLSEALNDHWSGRCAMLPITATWAELGFPQVPESTTLVEPGEQRFAGLSEAEQRQLMGPAMWQAWKDGKFRFGDLSTPTQDDVYGEMLVEASLKGLLGEGAKAYYQNGGAP